MLDLNGYYKFASATARDSFEAFEANLKKKRGPIVAAIELNLDTAEQYFIAQALVEWRHGIADPRPTLQQAIAVAHRVTSLLPEAYVDAGRWRPVQAGEKPFESLEVFNFSVAALMGVLLR